MARSTGAGRCLGLRSPRRSGTRPDSVGSASLPLPARRARRRRFGNPHRARPESECDRPAASRSSGGCGPCRAALRSRPGCSWTGFRTIVLPLLPLRSVRPCTAPSMTVIRMAVPKRSHQCRSICPDRPLRPNSSVPGDASGTTTPVGVLASVHNTNSRGLPCCTWPAGFADELGAALQEHDSAIGTEGVGGSHARRHAREARN